MSDKHVLLALKAASAALIITIAWTLLWHYCIAFDDADAANVERTGSRLFDALFVVMVPVSFGLIISQRNNLLRMQGRGVDLHKKVLAKYARHPLPRIMHMMLATNGVLVLVTEALIPYHGFWTGAAMMFGHALVVATSFLVGRELSKDEVSFILEAWSDLKSGH